MSPATKQKPDAQTGIQSIPHSQLEPSPLNPRRSFDHDKLVELSQSIREKGLLQNLVVRPRGKGYEVAAGERRWRAIKQLVEVGVLLSTYPVPCQVTELTDLELVTLATTENVNRQDMHPLDEAEAFAKMIELGADVETISLKMGLAEKTIKQRLALAGRLSSKAKEALAEDAITLGQAQQLIVGTPETQDALVESIANGNFWNPTPSHIKNWFAREHMEVSTAIFELSAYTGEISNNLFDDEHEPIFLDNEQAKRLQLQAVETLRKKYEASWAWCKVEDYFYISDWETHKKTDPKTQGVVIEFSPHRMTVEVHEGVTKRHSGSTSSSSTQKEKPEYSKKHYYHVHNLRTAALQDKLLLSPDHIALVLGVMGLIGAKDVLIESRTTGSEDVLLSKLLERLGGEWRERFVGIVEKVADGRGPLRASAWNGEKNVALYEALVELDHSDLKDLFRLLVVSRVGSWNATWDPSFDSSALINRLAADLQVELPDLQTLGADYLKLYSKDKLCELADQVGLDGRAFEGLTKAKIIENILGQSSKTKGQVPKELQFAVPKAKRDS